MCSCLKFGVWISIMTESLGRLVIPIMKNVVHEVDTCTARHTDSKKLPATRSTRSGGKLFPIAPLRRSFAISESSKI